MNPHRSPADLTRLKVYPLESRRSLRRIEEVLVEPTDPSPSVAPALELQLAQCTAAIRAARERRATVMLIYGAHLVKNGGQLLVHRLIEHGWVNHLATNGAGTIHDWEFAFLGRSTESVRDNVATGTFGTWNETGRNIHLALLAGALTEDGYGRSLGRMIHEDGVTLPEPELLESQLRAEPGHPLAPARAELLVAMRRHRLHAGRHLVVHPWRNTSVLGQAYHQSTPVTVHPGIGYDIISNHPMFNGAVLGRAAEIDFRWFVSSVDGLDGGVVLSVGSAIMGPQVFEKSLSAVHNLRFQEGRPAVAGHQIYVVDLQDGGGWDWTQGEPPRENPAYYLRFCKSFSRMGGAMHYLQCDNVLFLHHLFHRLASS